MHTNVYIILLGRMHEADRSRRTTSFFAGDMNIAIHERMTAALRNTVLPSPPIPSRITTVFYSVWQQGFRVARIIPEITRHFSKERQLGGQNLGKALRGRGGNQERGKNWAAVWGRGNNSTAPVSLIDHIIVTTALLAGEERWEICGLAFIADLTHIKRRSGF